MQFPMLVVAVLAALAVACTPDVSPAQGCPTVADLRAYRAPEATRVYAADGSLVADLSPQRRIVAKWDEVPAVLRDGYVAVEDKRFWQHGGVDARGILRAVWRDVTTLSLREGFSTIPMQLARQIFPEELPRSDKVRRKDCELRLAGQIEEEYSKREILLMYLNQIYLGDGLYGVESAAQGYFGKPAAELDAAEAALIIGLAKSPEGYNPRKNPVRAVERRSTVLEVLVREGVLSAAEAERARAAPLRLAPSVESAGSAPYFVAAVRRELRERFGPGAGERGLRVYTGLDPELQQAAQERLSAQIRRIEKGELGRYRHAVPPEGRLAPAEGDGSPYLQGMVVALDPRTGVVRALVGGRDFTHSQFDRAFQARRQPGSAFKPIVYAAALEQGLTPATRLATTPVVLDERGSAPWSPDDAVPDSILALSARDALARSSNNAAVRAGQWAGLDHVIAVGRALGLTTDIPAYPAIFLGAADVVPAELVAAYAAFANGGLRVTPRLIERVEDARGRVLWRAPAVRQRALDEGVAFVALSMLEDVVDRGTGASVRSDGFWLPAAGKTGTTNGGKDTWFIGMTPDLVAGVWLGFDRPQPILAGASGSRLAAPVWADIMEDYYADRPAPPAWIAPPSVAAIAIDTATGAVATGNCPPEQIRIEYFLPGTEPPEYCPLHPETGFERLIDRLRRGWRAVF
jgi:penicillin-binding protein 1A